MKIKTQIPPSFWREKYQTKMEKDYLPLIEASPWNLINDRLISPLYIIIKQVRIRKYWFET